MKLSLAISHLICRLRYMMHRGTMQDIYVYASHSERCIMTALHFLNGYGLATCPGSTDNVAFPAERYDGEKEGSEGGVKASTRASFVIGEA